MNKMPFIILALFLCTSCQAVTPEEQAKQEKSFCQAFGYGSLKDMPAMCLKYYGAEPKNTLFLVK